MPYPSAPTSPYFLQKFDLNLKSLPPGCDGTIALGERSLTTIFADRPNTCSNGGNTCRRRLEYALFWLMIAFWL